MTPSVSPPGLILQNAELLSCSKMKQSIGTVLLMDCTFTFTYTYSLLKMREKMSRRVLWSRDTTGRLLGRSVVFPSASLRGPWSNSLCPPLISPGLLPRQQAGCGAAFPEPFAWAEIWFPLKVSPVRKGTRIKGFWKETQGIFLSSRSACFLLLWV